MAAKHLLKLSCASEVREKEKDPIEELSHSQRESMFLDGNIYKGEAGIRNII